MKKILPILILLTLGLSSVLGQTVPTKPSPPRLVNDLAGIFTAEQRSELETTLVEFEKTTSNQITVVTVSDLGGYVPSDYSLKILRDWGVGKDNKNNGIVILLKPRNDTKGEVNISIGYGLEGVLPDSKVGRLIDRFMMPSLREGNYFDATKRGVDAIIATIGGEYTADDELGVGDTKGLIQVGLFAIAIIILIIYLTRKNRPTDRGDDDDDDSSGSGGNRRSNLPPIFWGGFGGTGRGGGFGGGGGGGFGGFGGGSGGGGGGGRSF